MNQDKRVIYKTVNGGVSILIPALNCDMMIDEIARKDVPAGLKYKIVTTADLPTDRTFRDAWTVDELTLTDGVGDQ